MSPMVMMYGYVKQLWKLLSFCNKYVNRNYKKYYTTSINMLKGFCMEVSICIQVYSQIESTIVNKLDIRIKVLMHTYKSEWHKHNCNHVETISYNIIIRNVTMGTISHIYSIMTILINYLCL